MIFYTCLFAVSLLLAFLSTYDFPQRRFRTKPLPALFFLSGLVIAVVFGVREGFGTDYYEVYVSGYSDISSGQGSRFEPGFVLLCKLLVWLGFDYHSLFFVTSCMVVALVYLAIYNQSKDIVLGVFIFLFGGFLFFSSNGVRQAVAIAILLNAIPYVTRFEPVKYIALVVLASSFHSTALIFLPMIFLGGWQPDDRKSIISFVSVICFGGVISSGLISLAATLSPQVARYAGAEHLAAQYLASGNIDLADYLVCSVSLTVFLILKYCKRKSFDRQTVFLFELLMIGVAVCYLSKHVMIFSRLAAYFTPLCIVAIPRLFRSFEGDPGWLVLFCRYFYLLFVFAAYFYLFGVLNFSHVVPYANCFTGIG